MQDTGEDGDTVWVEKHAMSLGVTGTPEEKSEQETWPWDGQNQQAQKSLSCNVMQSLTFIRRKPR